VIEGQSPDGQWRPLVRGTQIGIRQIFPIAAAQLTGVRLKVEKSIGQPAIRELSPFYVNRPVPKTAIRSLTTQGK
jgi:hypothetical protein